MSMKAASFARCASCRSKIRPALADGAQAVTAHADDRSEVATAYTRLVPSPTIGPPAIHTLSPRVIGPDFDRRTATVLATLKDNLSDLV
jgi:hypothetical protein